MIAIIICIIYYIIFFPCTSGFLMCFHILYAAFSSNFPVVEEDESFGQAYLMVGLNLTA